MRTGITAEGVDKIGSSVGRFQRVYTFDRKLSKRRLGVNTLLQKRTGRNQIIGVLSKAKP